MMISFIILTVVALLIVGGLKLNMSLYKRDALHGGKVAYSNASQNELHNVIFQHN